MTQASVGVGLTLCPCGLSSSRIYCLFPHSLLQKCVPCKDPLSPPSCRTLGHTQTLSQVRIPGKPAMSPRGVRRKRTGSEGYRTGKRGGATPTKSQQRPPLPPWVQLLGTGCPWEGVVTLGLVLSFAEAVLESCQHLQLRREWTLHSERRGLGAAHASSSHTLD